MNTWLSYLHRIALDPRLSDLQRLALTHRLSHLSRLALSHWLFFPAIFIPAVIFAYMDLLYQTFIFLHAVISDLSDHYEPLVIS